VVYLKRLGYDDGKTQVLLCIHGTLAISFRNNAYHIPIAIWIPFLYPEQPPMCYVTPTASMLIRTSQHVDAQGRIYHPQLAYWNPV
jgi:ESCRT-I complex subunit TSG101